MDDLISRQATIDVLKGLPTWWADEGGYYGGAQPPMVALLDPEDAVSAIENLPSAQLEQQWIPCNERLPEENGQYLISVKYKHIDGYDDIYAEHGEWSDGKWDIFCFGHCGEVENIIAWRPLPEPYSDLSE